MADTLTLDTAVHHVLGRGGRVCLVGDDQQLGAVGAGGVLADLDATYGAVPLMLAPSRRQVADLNQRARTPRLPARPPSERSTGGQLRPQSASGSARCLKTQRSQFKSVPATS